MRSFIVFPALCATLLLIAAMSATTAASDDMTVLFSQFKAQYNKQYSNEQEELQRFNHFQSNMAKAAQEQANEPEAEFGMTSLSDLSEEELAAYSSAAPYYASRRNDDIPTAPNVSLPELAATGDTVDWRKKGAVTYVRNQGSCGSCWAITSVQAIEAYAAIAGYPLTPLSTQQLVSCDPYDGGCRSGFMTSAFSWLLSARGGRVATEASYPYVGYAARCSDSGNKPTGAVIIGQQNLPKSESQMAAWLYSKGPIAIAIDSTSWSSYRGGIMTNCRRGAVNHGVLLVGMGVSPTGTRYWIVKNSWGAGWGEGGYIRLKMGTDQCLITHWPVVPIVKPKPRTPAPRTPAPTKAPTARPTVKPTAKPTMKPTAKPTARPTVKPTLAPTVAPTTIEPTTLAPTTEAPNATTTVDANATLAPNATLDANATSAPNATVDGNATLAPNSTTTMDANVTTLAPNNATIDANATFAPNATVDGNTTFAPNATTTSLDANATLAPAATSSSAEPSLPSTTPAATHGVAPTATPSAR